MSESPAEVVRQRGLWFEELRTGVVYRHSPGRTIGEADNTLFSTLTMNPQSLHLDAAFSESTEFGERLVNSLLTMSVLVGPLRGSPHPGHDRGEPRVPRREIPRAGPARRHDLR